MLYTDCDQAMFFFIKAHSNIATTKMLSALASSLDDTIETLGFERDTVGEWTVFQNDIADDPWHYSASYDQAETIAGDCDMVYCYYSTYSCGGVLKVIQNGKVMRDFWDYPDDDELAEDNKNIGLLEYEANAPIASWVDIIDYINDLLLGN